jgi:hypothetical protein
MWGVEITSQQFVHNLSQIVYKLLKSTISTRKTIIYAGFHLTFSNFISNFIWPNIQSFKMECIKNCVWNAINQPLEAKMYENVLDKDPPGPPKSSDFCNSPLPSWVPIYKFVNFPLLDFPVQHWITYSTIRYVTCCYFMGFLCSV